MLKELNRYTHKEDGKYITYIPVFNNYVNERAEMTLSFLIGKLKELRIIYGDCRIDINELTNDYLDATLEKDSTKEEIEEHTRKYLEDLTYAEEQEKALYEKLKKKYESL
jgi:hypothetical protein